MKFKLIIEYYRSFVEARKRYAPGVTIGLVIGLLAALAFYIKIDKQVASWHDDEAMTVEEVEDTTKKASHQPDQIPPERQEEVDILPPEDPKAITYKFETGETKKITASTITTLLPFWTASTFTVILLLILGYGFYRIKGIDYDHARYTDDPEEVKEVVQAHIEEILKLGTPRKIKRLLNKVRFQYSIMEKEGLIGEVDFHLYFRLILIHEGYKHLITADDDLFAARVHFLYAQVFEENKLPFGKDPKSEDLKSLNHQIPSDSTVGMFWKYNEVIVV